MVGFALGLTALATTSGARADYIETCDAMATGSLNPIFANDDCQKKFLDYQKTHTAWETSRWLMENRGCLQQWSNFAWLAAARRDPAMAELTWIQQLVFVESRAVGSGGSQGCDSRQCLETKAKALFERGLTQKISDEDKALLNSELDRAQKDTTFKDRMQKALDTAGAICAYHQEGLECTNAMTTALKWMYPYAYTGPNSGPGGSDSGTVSMLSFMREVFADDLIQKYASRLALRVMDSVAASSIPTNENLYQLGLEAFEGDEARLFKFLAVYATRGAAWGALYQIAGPTNRPLLGAFMVVSVAMTVLDSRLLPDGRAWSYGPGQSTTCYQNKPYHYWMTASFSHLLLKAGYSEHVALFVSRLLGAMYEVGSDTFGRNPDEIYFLPTFDPKVSRVRREIVHHLSGARFGLAPGPQAQPFDQLFAKSLACSQPLPKMSESEMKQKIKNDVTRWQYWTSLTGFYCTAE